MSYGATPARHGNLHVIVAGRHRLVSLTTSSGVIESSDVVQHCASRHPALLSDVMRSVTTAIVLFAIAAMFLKIRFTDSTIGQTFAHSV